MKDKNIRFVKWFVDFIMGIILLISFSTGLLKFIFLMQLFNFTDLVLPMARISDIHDRSGLILGILVAVHLYLNRGWIIKTTKVIFVDRKVPE